MSRTTIAAVLAMLLALAPAASARPVDVSVTAKPQVMSERITDTYYSTKGNPDVGALVLEQESTSGSGNQGVSRPAPVPVAADDDGEPWPLIGAGVLGIALLVGAAVALVAKPGRTRVAA